MEEQNNGASYNKQVIETFTVANEYCLFIEKAHKYSKLDVLNYFSRILPLLYLKGSLLPDIEVENPEINERFVTVENYEIIFNDLLQMLGKDDKFWYINEKEFIDNEISKGSISECLTDIYQDLKDFVMLYQKNSNHAKQNAVKSLRYLYKVNWGYKSLIGLKAIHYTMYPDINSIDLSDF
ncbi:DUF5063 domain-containing protein [Bacteroidota bacterium]